MLVRSFIQRGPSPWLWKPMDRLQLYLNLGRACIHYPVSSDLPGSGRWQCWQDEVHYWCLALGHIQLLTASTHTNNCISAIYSPHRTCPRILQFSVLAVKQNCFHFFVAILFLYPLTPQEETKSWTFANLTWVKTQNVKTSIKDQMQAQSNATAVIKALSNLGAANCIWITFKHCI